MHGLVNRNLKLNGNSNHKLWDSISNKILDVQIGDDLSHDVKLQI